MPGYKYMFVDRVKRRWICYICSLPMREPVQITTCGHKFCDSCLQEFLRYVLTLFQYLQFYLSVLSVLFDYFACNVVQCLSFCFGSLQCIEGDVIHSKTLQWWWLCCHHSRKLLAEREKKSLSTLSNTIGPLVLNLIVCFSFFWDKLKCYMLQWRI